MANVAIGALVMGAFFLGFKVRELFSRLESLENMGHHPVDWDRIIEQQEKRLDILERICGNNDSNRQKIKELQHDELYHE